MSQQPESVAPGAVLAGFPSRAERPQRIKLRGSVLLLIQLPNQRQVHGNLHQVSLTGGLINLEKPLDEKLRVEVIFHLGETTVREQAEILFPLWATQGWLQPFRFIDLPEASKRALQTTLLAFIHRQTTS